MSPCVAKAALELASSRPNLLDLWAHRYYVLESQQLWQRLDILTGLHVPAGAQSLECLVPSTASLCPESASELDPNAQCMACGTTTSKKP
nr:uncharacterized protein LOC114082032 isoform X4 [Marmota flaviventris]